MTYPNTKPPIEQFEQIANACGGILSDIAANFKVARGTVYAWCEADPEFKQALEDSRERFIDLAESNLRKLVAGIPASTVQGIPGSGTPCFLNLSGQSSFCIRNFLRMLRGGAQMRTGITSLSSAHDVA